MRAWCFFYEVDGVIAAVWELLALIVACAVGLIVGLVTADGKLGLGVGSGFLAVFMVIHGIFLLMFK